MSLTNEEKEILKITADLWNKLNALPDKHPCDGEENCRDLHNLQNRLLARVAKRTDPDIVR